MSLDALVLSFLFLAKDTYQVAVEHYGKREYAKAAEEFEKAIEGRPAGSPEVDPEITLRLAQSLYLSHQFEKAIPCLEKVAASGAHKLEASYMLGNSYIDPYRPERAVAALAQMFGLRP